MKALALIPLILGCSVISGIAAAPSSGPADSIEVDEKSLQSTPDDEIKWVPIKAIDLKPNSTFEGKPVNDTFVVGYYGVLKDPNSKRARDVNKESKHKRASLNRRQATYTLNYCRDDFNQWLWQWQAHIAKEHVCGQWANAPYPPHADWSGFKTWFFRELNWWDSNSNSWQPLTNHYGGHLKTNWSFYLQTSFDWNECMSIFGYIVDVCHGTNPDTSGGRATARHWDSSKPSGYYDVRGNLEISAA